MQGKCSSANATIIILGLLLCLYFVPPALYSAQPDTRLLALLEPPAVQPTVKASGNHRIQSNRQTSKATLQASVTPSDASVNDGLGIPVAFKYLGCYKITPSERILDQDAGKDDEMTPDLCGSKCRALGSKLFEVTGHFQCFCGNIKYPASALVPEQECSFKCGGDRSIMCGGRWRGGLHLITSYVPPVLTLFIEPAKNRGSLFLSGRYKRWTSSKYIYQLKTMNQRVVGTTARFRREICVVSPGLKFFVGHAEIVLANWPGNSLWAITGDETGDWGLKRNGKYIGLHGPGGPFPTNETDPMEHIILPEFAKPWYRQYYDSRQLKAFKGNALFMPLGSRAEFPNLTADQLKPINDRKYTFMYVAGGTDPSRTRLYKHLLTPAARQLIPEDKANSNNNNIYLSSDKYAEVMQDSVFCLCPKGHSVEQFRLYEAIEAGAIPVFENPDSYLNDKMPPEYLASPMVFVTAWDKASEVMLQLQNDPVALQARQTALIQWYDRYMRGFFNDLEAALEKKAEEGLGFACQDS